jgi:outer membrane protein
MTKTTSFARTAAAVSGVLLATAVLAGTANAAPPAPPPAAAAGVPIPKIVVINRQAIISSSKAGLDIARQAQGYFQSAQGEFKAQGEGLRKEEQSLQQQIAILAPDVKKKKIADFQARAAAFQQKAQGRQAQIQYGVLKARQQLEAALGPILEGIMKERGANLLLDRQVVLLGTVDVDITKLAIQRLDQKLPTVKVQLANPPPEFLRAMAAQQQGGGQ